MIRLYNECKCLLAEYDVPGGYTVNEYMLKLLECGELMLADGDTIVID